MKEKAIDADKINLENEQQARYTFLFNLQIHLLYLLLIAFNYVLKTIQSINTKVY